MSKFKIRHITKYTYEVPVRDSANQIMLYPIQDEFQEVLQSQIVITGDPQVEMHRDYFGNQVGTFTHASPHQELIIDVRLVVETKPINFSSDNKKVEEQWAELRQLRYQADLIDFLRQENFSLLPEVMTVVESTQTSQQSPLNAAIQLCDFVFKKFTYKKGITTVESTLDEVWKLKSGVCQDFAHILLVMLRLIDIPARYVSGYICPNKSGMRGEGATHAWVEAFIPFFGWIGIDPTNNCIVNDSHVRLAVGKNFSDCSPVKGTYRGTSNHTLEVAVSVSYEDGSVVDTTSEVLEPEPITSFSKNSYRRHQEMQMQQ
jgi:transglutaminase-like putative cysteine protease